MSRFAYITEDPSYEDIFTQEDTMENENEYNELQGEAVFENLAKQLSAGTPATK
jgi:hypothetical protein